MKKRGGRRRLTDDEIVNASVETQILEALADFADALERGEVAERLTCRQVSFDLTPAAYSPGLVKRTRQLLRISQPLFASFLGVSAKTVRSWEQGVNTPSPMARRFMDEIRRAPDYWAGRLREAVTVVNGTAGDAAAKRR